MAEICENSERNRDRHPPPSPGPPGGCEPEKFVPTIKKRQKRTEELPSMISTSNVRHGFVCLAKILVFTLMVLPEPFVRSQEENSAETAAESSPSSPSIASLRSAVADAFEDYKKLRNDEEVLVQGETKLRETIDSVQQRHVELVELTQQVDEILRRKVNVMAVQHLQNRLIKTRDYEMQARDQTVNMTKCEVDVNDENDDDDAHAFVSAESFDHLLSPERIFSAHDAHAYEFCREALRRGVDELPVPEVPLSSSETNAAPDDIHNGQCASITHAAQIIQQHLLQSTKEKLYDHASNGAWIVHEFTSETFHPEHPRTVDGNTNTDWWKDYVPDDWIDAFEYLREQFGPEFEMPANVMGQPLSNFFSSSSSSLVINRPEMVLHPLVFPGSCWPLQGGKGFVTIALPYPISLSAVSLDHVRSNLLLNGDYSAAPKRIKVVGYPPCNDNKCNGLTFDSESPIPVFEFEFDLASGDTKTVYVQYDEAKTESEFEKNDEGSCSAPNSHDDGETATSCVANPLETPITRDDMLAALRFEVLENHGNPNYTCLYRLRVHGEAVE